MSWRICLLLALASAGMAEESKTPGEESRSKELSVTKTRFWVIDRLAVNMAGAFVKSMFPEMDRKPTEAPTPAPPAPSSEIRRAPINPLVSSMDGYARQLNHSCS